MTSRATDKTITTSCKPPFFRRLYVQLTLLGGITLVLAIFLFTWKTVHEQSSFAYESIKSQAETLAANIASVSGKYIVSADFGAFEQLLFQSAGSREGLAIMSVDKKG